MASFKTGFDYYNLDTNRYQDIRIKRLKKDCGCNGIAVYDYILCEIYRVRGCVLEWDENTAFDVAEYFGLKESQVVEIVNYCCSVGLFNKELLTNGRVLTSESIQRRFMEMSVRAKRRAADIPEKYKIIPEESPELPEIQPHSSGSLPQSKVKKSKVEKSKEKLSNESKKKFSPPSISDMEKYFCENGYTKEAAQKAFRYYTAGNWKDSKGDQVRNWKQKCIAVWFKPENESAKYYNPTEGMPL